MSNMSQLLESEYASDPQAAALLPFVYDKTRMFANGCMAAKAPGHPLDALPWYTRHTSGSSGQLTRNRSVA
jgi:hypothetical protein